jgi:hypothetical protein
MSNSSSIFVEMVEILEAFDIALSLRLKDEFAENLLFRSAIVEKYQYVEMLSGASKINCSKMFHYCFVAYWKQPNDVSKL